MAIDPATLQRLSKTFAKFQTEMANKPNIDKQLAEATNTLQAASADLTAKLQALGWDGKEVPEEFLERISADLESRLRSLEASISPGENTSSVPTLGSGGQTPVSTLGTRGFNFAPPGAKR